MTNPNATAVLFIIDASGSMGEGSYYDEESAVYKKLEKALHLMLEQQARKLAGVLTIDVGYFDSQPYFGIENADPMKVNLGMFAAGGTRLYDSAPVIIKRFEKRINNLPEKEKPGHVVVIIVTDGESSTASTPEGRVVKTQIENLARQGWDFAFLGADKQSFARVRGNLGLDATAGVYHPFTPEGIQQSADDLGNFISMARSGERAHF